MLPPNRDRARPHQLPFPVVWAGESFLEEAAGGLGTHLRGLPGSIGRSGRHLAHWWLPQDPLALLGRQERVTARVAGAQSVPCRRGQGPRRPQDLSFWAQMFSQTTLGRADREAE